MELAKRPHGPLPAPIVDIHVDGVSTDYENGAGVGGGSETNVPSTSAPGGDLATSVDNTDDTSDALEAGQRNLPGRPKGRAPHGIPAWVQIRAQFEELSVRLFGKGWLEVFRLGGDTKERKAFMAAINDETSSAPLATMRRAINRDGVASRAGTFFEIRVVDRMAKRHIAFNAQLGTAGGE